MRQGSVTQYAAPACAADRPAAPAYVYVGRARPDAPTPEHRVPATRLMQAGVTTELHVYPGAFHQFAAMAPTPASASARTADFVEGVKRAFAGGTSES